MHGILLGVFGFSLLLFYDVSQIRHQNRLTALFSIIGYTSIGAAVIFLIFSNPMSDIWSLKFCLGIGFSIVSGFLLIYSLFIELSYTSGFAPRKQRRTVSTGTYKLVRHPAFLWFAAFLLSLNLMFMSLSFFVLSMSLVVMDFILIFIEDRFIFPSLFSNYEEYKKEVPFLWPKLRSTHRSNKERL